MNELHRVHIGTAWLPDEKPRFGDERPRVFEFEWPYFEGDAVIRVFKGNVTLKQGLKSSTIDVNIKMLPNVQERWHHEPIEEGVDLEMSLLCGHGVQRWTMRHGIGELGCHDEPRGVWCATHSAFQLIVSDISHLELYLWRDEFAPCHP
jgi:hypothetical protein